eukprot:1140129-Rhodomonas_salina.1
MPLWGTNRSERTCTPAPQAPGSGPPHTERAEMDGAEKKREDEEQTRAGDALERETRWTARADAGWLSRAPARHLDNTSASTGAGASPRQHLSLNRRCRVTSTTPQPQQALP